MPTSAHITISMRDETNWITDTLDLVLQNQQPGTHTVVPLIDSGVGTDIFWSKQNEPQCLMIFDNTDNPAGVTLTFNTIGSTGIGYIFSAPPFKKSILILLRTISSNAGIHALASRDFGPVPLYYF